MFQDREMTSNQWIVIFIIISIPVINLIFLLLWATGGISTNNNLKNFSRATFKLFFIGLTILAAITFALRGKVPNTGFVESVYSPVKFVNSIEQKIVFDNVVADNFGVVSCEVTNKDTKAHSFTFIISFYEENNRLIGTAVGTVDHIDVGQTKTSQAVSTNGIPKNTKHYRANVDTVLY